MGSIDESRRAVSVRAPVANWPQASMVLHLLVHHSSPNNSASVNLIRADSVLILWKHGLHSVQGQNRTVTSLVPKTARGDGHSRLLEVSPFLCM